MERMKPYAKARRWAVRVLTAMLSVMLIVTMMPMSGISRVHAEPDTNADAGGSPAFSQQAEVDGNLITVEAPEGAFPAGAALGVSEITDDATLAKAEKAVDRTRAEGMNPALSYTYDIKVLDAEGNELQPADGAKIEVAFAMAPVADANLEPAVYHITEMTEGKDAGKLTAEALTADVNGKDKTVVVETDGFSLYTVEFTYEDRQFVLQGNETVSLSEILKEVGLTGDVETAGVSNEELFSASQENGKWILTSHRAFDTEEWLKVTIGGAEYVITVTDAQSDPFSEYWDGQNGRYNLPSGSYALGDDFIAQGYIFIDNGAEVTIDLNDRTLSRELSRATSKGFVIQNAGTLTILDTGSSSSGVIAGGYSSSYGGGIFNSGTLNFEGGTITENKTTTQGGGIFNHQNGTANITGGSISGNKAQRGGGIYNLGTLNVSNVMISGNTDTRYGGGIYNGPTSKLDISEETVIEGNNATIMGGGIYSESTLTMSGKPVIHNNGTGNLVLIGETVVVDVKGAFADGTQIAISADEPFRKVTSGFTASGNEDISVFAADQGFALAKVGKEVFISEEGEGISSWQALQDAVNNAEDYTRTLLTLSEDITAAKGDDRIRIPKNKEIVLDLAGHTLNRNRTSSDLDGHVIQVESDGKLTVADSSGNDNGRITGGYAKRGGGINISEDGWCEFKGGTITGNKASVDGGGVYVRGTFRMLGGSIENNGISEAEVDGGGIYVNGGDGGVLKMTGGRIQNNDTWEINTSNKNEYGGDGGGICATSGATVDISNVTFNGNLSRKSGGAIWTTASATIRNCTFEYNHPVAIGSTKEEYDTFNHYYYNRFNDTYDGGAIYIGGSGTVVNIDRSKFTGNYINNYALQDEHGSGGAIYLDEGKLNINDSTFENNKSWEGGAIYCDSGTTVSAENTKFNGNSVGITDKYSDEAAPKKIPVSSQGGGAISSYGTLTLEGCTFTGNHLTNETKDAKGGAIYSEGALTMTGVTCTENNGRNGGAIYLDSGQPNLTNCTMKENSADEKGGGVYVDTSKPFNVKGEMIINDNSASSGNDVYLPDDKFITLTGKISGSDIGVSLEDKFGKFSKNFSTYHSGDIPIAYFYSCDGHDVILKDGEGYIQKGDIDDTGKFIGWKDQIFYNANRLSGPNWMSGVSGERYLNEINIPGTHDSSMYNVSAKGCLSGSIGAWQATTQREYIFEQLEHGSRFFDVRMKTRYCSGEIAIGGIAFGVGLGIAIPVGFIPVVGVPLASLIVIAGSAMLINESMLPEYKDDGKNLWTCHGRSAAGTFYALDDKDKGLSVAKELEWMKDFLREHPTETIIIDARPETDESGGEEFYGPLERFVGIMEELSKETNPTTGESYVYWEDGKVGKMFTRWPKLKDCRGKIVLFGGKGPAVAETIGGLYKNIEDIPWESGKGTFQDGIARVGNLQNFLNTQKKLDIPRDAMDDSKMEAFYWNKLNTTDTMFLKNPVELAEDYVLPAMFGTRGLVNESKKGRYFGWFSMDAPRANHYRDIWITNFPNDLDYCTVTVKSGLSGSNAPKEQTYKLLRGTTIPIPGCIYSGAKADEFAGWKASTDGETYIQNNTYRIQENVTFTAQWAGQLQTPVTAVWKDADDVAGKRPEQLLIHYNNDYKQTLTKVEGWSAILSGDLSGKPVVDVPEDYEASIEGSAGQGGYVITLTHTPDVSVNASGTVTWDDREDMDEIRPDSVTLHLYANGEEIRSGTATKAGGWSFDLGDHPRYKDGELVAYKLVEDNIEVDGDYQSTGYTSTVKAVEGEKNAITGFNVTNTHEVVTTVVYARIEWDDNNNAEGERPDQVMVRWIKNDVPGETIVVNPEDESEWVVGLELTSAEMKEIESRQQEIIAQRQAEEINEEEFLEAMKGTLVYSIEQDPVEAYTTTVTWKENEDGSGTYLQILNTYGKHSLTFYQDTEGNEIWQRKLINDGTSLAEYADYGTEAPDLLKKEGYTFAGWATEPGIVVDSYRDKNGNLNPKLDGKLINWNTEIKEDMKAYPIWIRDRLNVVIVPGGDDVIIDDAQALNFTVNIDEKIVMRYLATATRDGYKLDGWYTKGGVLWNGENWKALDYVTEGLTETGGWGVTPEYCDKDEAGNPIINTNDKRKFKYYTVTLTAHWIPKEVTVKYDLGGHAASGAAAPASSKLTLGSTATLAAAPDTSNEYIFTGWKSPDGKQYSAGGTFLFDNWTAQIDPNTDSPSITMTAQYVEKAKVSLIFDANGGSAVEPVTVHEGNSIDLNDSKFKTTRTGYEFVGWYNSKGDKCEGIYAFTENETLTAHWKVKQYTITFDSAGGSEVGPIRQDFDTDITAPEKPAKDHYNFGGWVPALPKTMPAENMTVKASWKPITYSISFDTDGGSDIEDIEDIYGALITAPENPTKDGCRFEGWMDEDGEPATLPSYMPDTTPTYTAKWHQHKPGDPVREKVAHATCEKSGSCEVVTYCVVCDEELSRENRILPATDHDWGEWTETSPATELKEGSETRTCKNDSSHTETRVIPVLGHKHRLTKVKAEAATCEKDGSIEYWICDKGENPCGRYFLDADGSDEINREDTIVKTTGHDWGAWTVQEKATEIKEGLEVRTCSNDPNHKQERAIPVLGHKHSLTKVKAKAATCGKDGSIEYWICDKGENPCGRYFLNADGSDEINREDTIVRATGHDWGEWTQTKASTCSAEGEEERVCKNDASHKETRETAIDPDAHKWGAWTVQEKATEIKEGLEVRTCSNDPNHKQERAIPVLGHRHSLTKVKAKAATCGKDGNIEYWICGKGENPCGRYFADSKGRKEINKEDTIVKATGHKWGKWKVTKKPTATAAGERQRVCKNEPAHVEKQKIPATGGSRTLLPEMTAKGKRDLAFSWTKVDGAAGYDIFLAKCNKGNKVFHCKIIKTIKGNKTFSWTEKGLKKRTSYKAYVKAYVMKDGRKIYVKTSPVMHAYTSGGTKKYTNAKEVTVKKAAVSIKAGKKYKIRASVKKLKKKKKLIPKGHAPKLRYMSSNAKIAVVNSSGKITAKTKGTCTIYVYAHNGVYKTVRVTVK